MPPVLIKKKKSVSHRIFSHFLFFFSIFFRTFKGQREALFICYCHNYKETDWLWNTKSNFKKIRKTKIWMDKQITELIQPHSRKKCTSFSIFPKFHSNQGHPSVWLHLLQPVGLLGCLRLARVDDARGQISGQVNSGSVLGSVSGCISDSALNPKSARGAKGFWCIRSSCLDSQSYAKNHWMSDCVWPVGDATFQRWVLTPPRGRSWMWWLSRL